MKEQGSVRNIGIDLVKSVAVLFVICIHFSLNTKYYNTPVSNLNMALQTFIRWLFVPSVPMFLLCTGYLNHHKVYDRSYFKKILRVVVPYLVISIVCIAVKRLESPAPTAISWNKDVFGIFNFTANGYSWYVNMFIGLYLLAPALNIVFHALDRKKLHILFIILMFIVILPMTFNPVFSYSEKYSVIFFPDWWQDIYPVFYYFIGAYIAKFAPVKIAPNAGKIRCVMLLAALAGLQTLILVLAQPYLQNNWALTSYGSILVMTESVCIFLLLYQTDIQNRSVRRIIQAVSTITLETYLFSYIVDNIVYGWFNRNIFGELTQEQIFQKYFLIIVPVVFLSSLALASVYHLAENGIKRIIGMFRRTDQTAASERKAEPTPRQ